MVRVTFLHIMGPPCHSHRGTRGQRHMALMITFSTVWQDHGMVGDARYPGICPYFNHFCTLYVIISPFSFHSPTFTDISLSHWAPLYPWHSLTCPEPALSLPVTRRRAPAEQCSNSWPGIPSTHQGSPLWFQHGEVSQNEEDSFLNGNQKNWNLSNSIHMLQTEKMATKVAKSSFV